MERQGNPNPESQKIFACGIWNLGSFDGGISGPGRWNLEPRNALFSLHGATDSSRGDISI